MNNQKIKQQVQVKPTLKERFAILFLNRVICVDVETVVDKPINTFRFGSRYGLLKKSESIYNKNKKENPSGAPTELLKSVHKKSFK